MAFTALNAGNFTETVEKPNVTLVDFWAPWCGPCKKFGPIFEAASERHAGVTFAKVDTDSEQELAASLGIQSIPTVMAFKAGELVFRQSGLMSASQLDELIAKVSAAEAGGKAVE